MKSGDVSLSVSGMRPPPALVSYRHYKERGLFIRRKITFTHFLHRKHENPALKFKYSGWLYNSTVMLDFHSHIATDPLNIATN
jgi:hypothetical protein